MNPTSANQEKKPTTFGTLAKTIRGRTTDLLAIAVVLIAGLTFGRQVIVWWRADEPAVVPAGATAATTGWGTAGTPVDLQFGELPVGFTRQTLSGELSEVRKRLVALCAEKAQAAPLPQHPADQAELTLLYRVSGQTAAASQPGVWEVFLLERPLPMAIGVRLAPGSGESRRQGVDQPSRRMVCWGWLMPVGTRTFTAWCVQPGGTASANDAADWPLPPGTRRLLSFRGSQGQLTAFSGFGPVEDWMKYYSDLGRERGWPAIDWQPLAAGWSARIRNPSGEGTVGEASMHFSPGRDGGWTGLIDVIHVPQPRGVR